MTQKSFPKKILVFLLAFMLVFTGLTPALAQESSSIIIYHTNDIHGRINKSDSQIGCTRITTLVEAEKELGKNILLLDAGDTIHGKSIVNLSQGESVIQIMNQMKYDGMTAGNHDFNYGQERLLELIELANFPIMGANVLTENGDNFLESYFIKEFDGKKILIMGLSTPETLFKSHPKNTEGLIFLDPIERAKQIIAENRSDVDFVIALSHLGQEGDYTSIDLAEKVNGIDLIIDGHSHHKGELIANDTIIVQTGEYGQGLGKVVLKFNGENFTLSSSVLEVVDFETIEENKEVLDIFADYQEDVDTVFNEIIGQTTILLQGDREFVRRQETNLGNLVTDAILSATEADLVLTNGGGIRASIEPGNITRKDIFEVLPFGNLIAVKDVPGSAIKEMLEFSARLYPESNGGFLQVAGITFAIDETKEPLMRIHDVKINGEKLDPAKIYSLATNDFVAAGGDDYKLLANYPITAELISLEEALADYIIDIGGLVTAKEEHRIRIEEMKTEQIKENMYIVKPGDNLSKIASQYSLTWQDLQKVNKLKNPNLIFPNQKIIIPATPLVPAA